MKNLQKGFTLVELIVVITILAILGTIAFISLQGYSQDARDSKVTSDVRSLASAIETSQTQEWVSIHSFNEAGRITNNGVVVDGFAFDNTFTILGDVSLTGTTASDAAGVSIGYRVGDLNFVALKQNSADFGTSEYVIGTVTQNIGGESYSMYQIVGAKGISGQQTAVVKGNFIPGTGTGGLAGLVSASGATTPLVNDIGLGLFDLN